MIFAMLFLEITHMIKKLFWFIDLSIRLILKGSYGNR